MEIGIVLPFFHEKNKLGTKTFQGEQLVGN